MARFRLQSWNVNGIRAVHKKGFMDWFNKAQPDIVALQEIRAHEKQVPQEIRDITGYHGYWHAAEIKPGYSGVGMLTKHEPLDIRYGFGIEEFDVEGRVMVAEFDYFTLFNVYFPSGSHSQARVGYKMAFNEAFLEEIERVRKQGSSIILCGDVNIAHNAIDLAHPKANEKNSGFLPIERAWMDKMTGCGYIDTFRHLYPDAGEAYSWWTARGTARQKNVGWRIDYFLVSDDLVPNLRDATIHADIPGSDHCPVGLEIEF
jgi:exodeoxyribonuclease-3